MHGPKSESPFALELRGHEGLGGGVLGEHLFDPSDRLAGAPFVLDQAESYVAVAVVAEAYAGAYGYLGFRQ